MPTGIQLSRLVEDVRHEIGDDPTTNVGVGDTVAIKNRIRRKQNWLYQRFDWPHLRLTFEIELEAGERYYDLPTGLNYDKIEQVSVFYSGKPVPVTRGISFEQFAQYDSDSDERASPVQRWDIKRPDADVEQIEVWPIPDGDDQVLQFRGIKALRTLIADADLCDLDSDLLVLQVAADLATKNKSEDAKRIATQAEDMYLRLTANSQGGGKIIPMGQPYNKSNWTGDKAIVRVR
jgi:hypothetical protein